MTQQNDIIYGLMNELEDTLEQNGIPVSASAVRTYLDAGQKEQVRQLVPKTTMIFLEQHRLI